MEPLTLITSALVAGATVALKEVGGQAVKDAYAALKKLVEEKFSGNSAAETALQEHEKDPDTYEKPLKKWLTATSADIKSRNPGCSKKTS